MRGISWYLFALSQANLEVPGTLHRPLGIPQLSLSLGPGSLDYAPRGCSVAHHPRYRLPITSGWKCSSPLALRRRPSRLLGCFIFATHPILTPHIYHCLVILQSQVPFRLLFSIFRSHRNHQDIYHHTLAEAAPARQHFTRKSAIP